MAEVMPPEGWKAWAGPSSRTFFDKLNGEAAKILGAADGPFEWPEMPAGTTTFYAAMSRGIEFHRPFQRSSKVPLSFAAPGGRKDVHFFGIRGRSSGDFADSVRILA
jgi:hypothetical protein